MTFHTMVGFVPDGTEQILVVAATLAFLALTIVSSAPSNMNPTLEVRCGSSFDGNLLKTASKEGRNIKI